METKFTAIWKIFGNWEGICSQSSYASVKSVKSTVFKANIKVFTNFYASLSTAIPLHRWVDTLKRHYINPQKEMKSHHRNIPELDKYTVLAEHKCTVIQQLGNLSIMHDMTWGQIVSSKGHFWRETLDARVKDECAISQRLYHCLLAQRG